jgi:hypothetical protein
VEPIHQSDLGPENPNQSDGLVTLRSQNPNQSDQCPNQTDGANPSL